ncbi:cell wall binding repeat-containing protein [Clostridium sp. DL-VIII]|uniref:leucine-rich repeat domain-containing protein n=1 Tax=Clostridium sp. DL-VIII TaxID=641107 RepID=UPI00023AFF47|nr:leucine-rich repeat domain-containing protein [Clostridium sp. DL-VIII]EHJ00333.1 cell wall binding repeat-containing protein [Clostridium sp. DL-VIII]
MKKSKLTKVIAMSLIAASALGLNPIKASAEWKQNKTGWWFEEGDSWATGWERIDGKWYYFDSHGYMEHNKTVGGYYLDTNGAWINLTTTSDGLKFDKSTGTIVGYSGSNTDVTIPSEIDGVTVTQIGVGAFSGSNNHTQITSVKIPESVTSIGVGAFEWCNYLKTVNIPQNVKSIEASTFDGCTQLTNITIPNGVTSIGQVAFTGCTSLTSITIPNSVTFIGNIAFKKCNGLTSIDIPSSVTYISGGAFNDCINLTTVNVSSTTKIAAHVFDNSPNVKINTVN